MERYRRYDQLIRSQYVSLPDEVITPDGKNPAAVPPLPEDKMCSHDASSCQ